MTTQKVVNIYSSIIHNNPNWEQPKYPSTDKWIDKIWYTHTMEYYSATKRNKVLIRGMTWMDLEDMLSERSQSPKTHV